MNAKKKLNQKRSRRIARNRAKIIGTALRPRLSVSRSNRNIHAQLIDDARSHTLAHASSREIANSKEKRTKSDLARSVGELLGKRSAELGIKAVVFDRRGYKYHGRVKAFAEGAKSKGLKI